MIADRFQRIRAIVRHIPWVLEHEVRTRLGFTDAEEVLEAESEEYWSRPPSKRLKRYSHWRGMGQYDEVNWQALGRDHLDLFRQFCLLRGLRTPLRTIVDWGCGGGANAVWLAGEAENYYGVDISSANLEECGRQLSQIGYQGFRPILIDVRSPEAVFQVVETHTCDFFLCTNVFDVLPSPEYGLRILAVARDLLSSRGGCMIHFRYRDGRRYFEPKRWGYTKNLLSMTSYDIPEFWKSAEGCGLRPLSLLLRPVDVVRGDNFAYLFAARR